MFKINIRDSFNPNYRFNEENRYFVRFCEIPLHKPTASTITFNEIRFSNKREAEKFVLAFSGLLSEVFFNLDSLCLRIKNLHEYSLEKSFTEKQFITISNNISKVRNTLLYQSSWICSDLLLSIEWYIKSLKSLCVFYHKKNKVAINIIFDHLTKIEEIYKNSVQNAEKLYQQNSLSFYKKSA